MTEKNLHSDAMGWDIEFSSLSVGYGEHIVLHDITAHLPGGKISVILGGSGCGKSTLLKHIIGLAQPLHGSISVAGKDLLALTKQELRRIRRQMGVLFQDGALLGAMRVWENVALPLTEHLSISRDAAKREAVRVLSMVELEDFADFYPNQLSGGMRKRAGLARAIIANPRVLLCDEPTSGLDPITAARMDDLLLFLHKAFPTLTLVVVSHDLASLERIAEHVLVLREGHLAFEGSIDQLRGSNDAYIQQFLHREAAAARGEFSEQMQDEVARALKRWLES